MVKARKPPPPAAVTLSGAAPSPPRRRKKKGRPSLLDLQRRSLRLQAQSANPTPSPSGRRTRRSANTSPSDDDEEEDWGSGKRRREKRLKSVLSGGGGEVEEDEANDSAKATGARQGGDASDCGPTATALPDKKLLDFILDRLQKKDTYGVFSEPVDPEELPDYHEIVEHPMDFATIRKKLSRGVYTNLEQFENDVFLLTSNAMCYNSPDTIYHRQARSIEELAKKNFENLRQASDDDEEQEPKTVVRRGRPPKNLNKTVDHNASSDLSNTKVAKPQDNAETARRKGLTGDKAGSANISTRDFYGHHQSTFGLLHSKKSEKNGDYPGSLKWKKITTLDESRRSTYLQPLASAFSHEHPLLAVLDGGRKLLVPVGLQQEYAYARSLARFAAKLGPVGWDIAARSIRRVLPPGTNFGPGWVIDGKPPENAQLLMSPCVHPSSQPNVLYPGTVSRSDECSQRSEPSSSGDATEKGYMAGAVPVGSTSAGIDKSLDLSCKVPMYENGVGMSCDGANTVGQRSPSQHLNRNPEIRSNMNGFNAAPNIIRQSVGKGLFGSDMQMTHNQVLEMFSAINGRINGFIHGHQLSAEGTKTAQNNDAGNASSPLPNAGHDPPGALQQNKSDPVPPNLKDGIQSSDSVLDFKQPDLALQL